MDPAWHRFAVDDEPFYRRTYPAKTRVNDGPWKPVENLDATRIPDTPGVGRSLPANPLSLRLVRDGPYWASPSVPLDPVDAPSLPALFSLSHRRRPRTWRSP